MKRILSRGGVFAAALALTFCFGVAVPAQAETIQAGTNDELVAAVNKAKSGDTIELAAGTSTLYNKGADVQNKDLTFVGAGTGETTWLVGPTVPDPAKYGTEYNSDYSFDVRGTEAKETITFKNMTLQSGSVDYLGFAGTDNTVVENCVIEGKTFYWGYTSATFKNTVFEAPNADYSIWTYSSPTMTFDQCTFNCSGKAINVYTDYDAGKHDITVNVNNCTFNFKDAKKKTALKINDSNMGNYEYVINFTGKNSASGTVDTNKFTCSKLFGFDPNDDDDTKSDENSGRTDVYIEGENGGRAVWTEGQMQTHTYTDGYAEQNYTRTTSDWVSLGNGKWMCTETAVCNYCGYTFKTDIFGFDLAYNMNGSTDAQTSDFNTVEHVDSSCTITTAVPVRAGYKFVKWNTAADGSGTSYNPGDTFSFDDAAPATLYAQWEKVDSGNPTPTDPTPAATTKKVTKAVPKTGDVTNVVLPAVIAVLAVVAIAAALFVRRKNQQ